MEFDTNGTLGNLNEIVVSVVGDVRDFYGQKVYGEIGSAVAKSNSKARVVMRLVGIGSKHFLLNFFLIIAAALFLRYFRIPERDGNVFQYGVSRNNVAAFDKLNSCLANYENIIVVKNGRLPTWRERLKAVASLKLIFLSAKILSSNPHENPFVHLQCLIASVGCVFFSANPLPESFRALCVANDHAPIPRSLIKICRARGMKTIYIQHAPVTEYFPPLSTDLAILYDDASSAAYRMSAEKNGVASTAEVVLMPPFSNIFRQPVLGDGLKIVGLCIGRYPQTRRLLPIIQDLVSETGCVKEVVLRPHPACDLDLSSLLVSKKVSIQRAGRSLQDFSDAIDLALVSNSGVALELLHNGVMTFYVEGMDDLANDYYGFVKSNILPRFEMTKLKS